MLLPPQSLHNFNMCVLELENSFSSSIFALYLLLLLLLLQFSNLNSACFLFSLPNHSSSQQSRKLQSFHSAHIYTNVHNLPLQFACWWYQIIWELGYDIINKYFSMYRDLYRIICKVHDVHDTAKHWTNGLSHDIASAQDETRGSAWISRLVVYSRFLRVFLSFFIVISRLWHHNIMMRPTFSVWSTFFFSFLSPQLHQRQYRYR